MSSVTDASFGARLRRERERRQITLSSIAANTKINLGLLQALERDDLSRWPSGIFRRAFIRAYAEAAGLDPVAITHEFLEQYPDATDDSPREQASTGTPLRLTLDDDNLSFLEAQLLSHWRQRCVASVWDFSVTLAYRPAGVPDIWRLLGSVRRRDDLLSRRRGSRARQYPRCLPLRPPKCLPKQGRHVRHLPRDEPPRRARDRRSNRGRGLDRRAQSRASNVPHVDSSRAGRYRADLADR